MAEISVKVIWQYYNILRLLLLLNRVIKNILILRHSWGYQISNIALLGEIFFLSDT